MDHLAATSAHLSNIERHCVHGLCGSPPEIELAVKGLALRQCSAEASQPRIGHASIIYKGVLHLSQTQSHVPSILGFLQAAELGHQQSANPLSSSST
jgi:hypothetical protein